MAAKIFAIVALIALSISAATAFTTPRFYSPFGVAAVTIPWFFPSVIGVESAQHSLVKSYWQQHQAFLGGISPFSAVIPQHPFAISQLPYFYNQLAIPQLPYLHNQLTIPQLPFWYNKIVISQLPYLYNQLPYWYNQFDVVANPAPFLPYNQLALRNLAAFWQQPIIGGAFF